MQPVNHENTLHVGYNYDITLGHYIFVILTLHEGYTPDVTLGHHIFVTLSRSAKSEKAVIVFYFEALLDVK